MRKLSVLFIALTATGCAAPSSGPTSGSIRQIASANEGLSIVDLNASIRGPIQTRGVSTLRSMDAGSYNGSVLRPGDDIEVTIFDTGEEGFFSSAEAKTLDLGRFTIDESGSVSLPFAGRLQAAGSTPGKLQDRIADALRGTSVNPHAVVTVVDRGGSDITINGAVNAAGRHQLGGQGEKILDAIALAGGAEYPPGETSVTVMRGLERATASLARILTDPTENIHLRPGDQIYVFHDAPTFVTFGAVKRTGEFDFEKGSLNLAQAIARAGGLLEDSADTRNLFVFRYEPPAVARSVGPAEEGRGSTAVYRPIIYRLDLTQGSSFFAMQSFMMQDGDIIYVAGTRLAELKKVFTLLRKNPPTSAAPLSGSRE